MGGSSQSIQSTLIKGEKQMKKLIPVLLTMALMVMLADTSGSSFAFEIDEGGSAAMGVESLDCGASSFAVESPETAAGVFVIESESGGLGSFLVEWLDGSGGLGQFYAQHPYLVH